MELPSSFLNAFTLHPRFDNNDRERPAIELGAARKNGIDEAVGLRKRDDGHWASEFLAWMRVPPAYAGANRVPSWLTRNCQL
jgi:hypothetical protein